jgi:hypothetical protein
VALSWAGARDKIRADLWKSATVLPDEVVDRALHAALLEIEAERRWLFLEVIRTSDVFSGSHVNLPADCGPISSLTFIHPGGANRDVLVNEHIERVRYASESGSSVGAPCVYARTDSKIFLDCDAPAGSRLEIVYTFETPDDVGLASSAGGNVTLEKQEVAVVALACAMLAVTRLKNESEAQRHASVYDRCLLRMVNKDDAERADHYGPSIQPDTSYQHMAFGG